VNQAVLAVAVISVALAVVVVLRRRQAVATPMVEHRQGWTVPTAIDRRDLAGADTPREPAEWAVIVFTSATCEVCHDVVTKAQVLASPHVDVIELEAKRDRDLHTKYGIDAVPLLLMCDETGAVRHGQHGPVTATDLWATLADLREPGSRPPACEH
jgi:hypothetical protein